MCNKDDIAQNIPSLTEYLYRPDLKYQKIDGVCLAPLSVVCLRTMNMEFEDTSSIAHSCFPIHTFAVLHRKAGIMTSLPTFWKYIYLFFYILNPRMSYIAFTIWGLKIYSILINILDFYSIVPSRNVPLGI